MGRNVVILDWMIRASLMVKVSSDMVLKEIEVLAMETSGRKEFHAEPKGNNREDTVAGLQGMSVRIMEKEVRELEKVKMVMRFYKLLFLSPVYRNNPVF